MLYAIAMGQIKKPSPEKLLVVYDLWNSSVFNLLNGLTYLRSYLLTY